MRSIHIKASREYDVLVERGLLDRAGELLREVSAPAWPPSCRTTRSTRSTASARSRPLKRRATVCTLSHSPRARGARTSRPTPMCCTSSVSTASAAATWSLRSAAAWWATSRALPRRRISAAWALPRSRRRCWPRSIRPSAARPPSTCPRARIRRAASISPAS